MEKFFELKKNGTNTRTEIVAGITTFMTMAYILVVNPIILGSTGMDQNAIFTATALSAAIATLILSLIHISEPTRREWLSRMPSSA